MKKLFLLLLLVSSVACGRDIKLIVPYSPGGSTDRLSRMLASTLSSPEYNFIVDYRLGAGGSIAANYVAGTKNETVIMITSNGLVGNPLINHTNTYDATKDFKLVDYIGAEPLLVVTSSDNQINDFRNFMQLSKTKSMPYGSAGVGSSGHLTSAIIADQNTNFIHVPYKGGSAVLVDLLARRIEWMTDSDSVLGPHINANKVKPLAVFYHTRLAQYPDVPTINELGINDRDFYRWHIMVANIDADPKVIAYLKKKLQDPEVKTNIKNLGIDTAPPKNVNNFLKSETTKLQKIIKDFNIVQ